jgi:arylsulfatase A-like enzyme
MLVAFVLLLALLAGPTAADAAKPAGKPAAGGKPNILVILTDEGRGDYSAFGTKDIRTPHMDRLCREGLTFQNLFANSCVCSPTRAALLTGCYPDRVGVPGMIREETPDDSWGLPRRVIQP